MNARTQIGAGMIEILAAIVVLGVGLAGVMSMDGIALRKNHESFLRTQAILQAQEMAERMHANPAGVTDGDYKSAIPTSEPTPNCLSAACTTTQMAAFDKWEWNQGNANNLPCGGGSIADPNSIGAHTITISWAENDQACSDTDLQSFSFFYKPLPLGLL